MGDTTKKFLFLIFTTHCTLDDGRKPKKQIRNGIFDSLGGGKRKRKTGLSKALTANGKTIISKD